jgi:hypothetical protein
MFSVQINFGDSTVTVQQMESGSKLSQNFIYISGRVE